MQHALSRLTRGQKPILLLLQVPADFHHHIIGALEKIKCDGISDFFDRGTADEFISLVPAIADSCLKRNRFPEAPRSEKTAFVYFMKLKGLSTSELHAILAEVQEGGRYP